jgi:hypothetical protein
MKYRIHWSAGDWEDSIDVEADTLEEIREKADSETTKRGLDEIKNCLWSEELEEK